MPSKYIVYKNRDTYCNKVFLSYQIGLWNLLLEHLLAIADVDDGRLEGARYL